MRHVPFGDDTKDGGGVYNVANGAIHPCFSGITSSFNSSPIRSDAVLAILCVHGNKSCNVPALLSSYLSLVFL